MDDDTISENKANTRRAPGVAESAQNRSAALKNYLANIECWLG